MQDVVSSRWLVVSGFAASLIILACSFLTPDVFPWAGIGWVGGVGLALSSALWMAARSPRSMAQVAQEVDTGPKSRPRREPRGRTMLIAPLVALSSLVAGVALAGTPEPGANLDACLNRLPSCQRFALTLVEMTEVTIAGQARAAADCTARLLADGKEGGDQCAVPPLLAPQDSQAAAYAEHTRNYAACRNRRGSCDRSRLTTAEAASIPLEPSGLRR